MIEYSEGYKENARKLKRLHKDPRIKECLKALENYLDKAMGGHG